MWRRIYLLLLLVRIYFALSPSYLHPDENFQGPEVIAGKLFPYPAQKTWEWTSSHPIRSVFPLWPVYGIPMTLLKWIWAEDNQGRVAPEAIYYALRLVMFFLSFVLEDWAIYELVHSPQHRRQVVMLLASSYVTWSYQSHTFSNSIETLLVAWSLVLIERILHQKGRSSIISCGILAFIFVFGVFNRITFPAFIVIPGLHLLPHFLSKPLSFLSLTASAAVFTVLAIATDTAFYHGEESTTSFKALFRSLRTAPVITPLNNIRYNAQTSNLALHGLHPHHQHFLINLPQLLGPALILLFTSIQPLSLGNICIALSNPRLLSALTGTAFLSIFPHQEPRFLLPCVPLFLTCIRIPTSNRGKQWFWTSWATFNILLGILMGIYHQGGVIPTQLQIPKQVALDFAPPPTKPTSATIFWWKTYPPPTYLLGDTAPLNITTLPLMGLSQLEMQGKLFAAITSSCQDSRPSPSLPAIEKDETRRTTYLVAPLSASLFSNQPIALHSSFSVVDAQSTRPDAHDLPEQQQQQQQQQQQAQEDKATNPTARILELTLQWCYRRHLNLDDIDMGTEGFLPTLTRVVGRRGIGIWRVTGVCVDG